MNTNPVTALNNFLQGHPSGDSVPDMSWTLTQQGPPHQVVHIAVAKFRGIEVGRGMGTSKGVAKKIAAAQALEHLLNRRHL
ncbi:hypothetical protein EI94DRAFT_1755987 [Lactarius quietus]|nr:hypothetical protein EI94DRAFT_1755987 [Lactarius quietus]